MLWMCIVGQIFMATPINPSSYISYGISSVLSVKGIIFSGLVPGVLLKVVTATTTHHHHRRGWGAAIQYCPKKRYVCLIDVSIFFCIIIFQNLVSGGATSMHRHLFVPKERSGRFSPKHPAPELGSNEIFPAAQKYTRMIAGATNPTHPCLAWKSKTKQSISINGLENCPCKGFPTTTGQGLVDLEGF